MTRFHLDEHVDPAIAHGLRLRGIDVTTSAEASLLGAPDEEHLDFARHESRAVVTHDADFLRLHAESTSHAGIVYSPPGTRSVGEIVRYLALMNACLDEGEMAGRVEFV